MKVLIYRIDLVKLKTHLGYQPYHWYCFLLVLFSIVLMTTNSYCFPTFFWRRFWKITIVLFVDVALRAASILKNHIYSILFTLQNFFICLDLSLGSMLEVSVLKNAAECTSQRLKWTSGARVVNLVFNALDLTLTNVGRT